MAIDESNFAGRDDTGWTNTVQQGSVLVLDGEKVFQNNSNTPESLGCHRDPKPSEVDRVLIFEWLLTGTSPDLTDVFLGVRNDDKFSVGPTIIMGYLNHNSPEGLNVQTFPSGNRVSVTANVVYRTKLEIQSDRVNVYIDGGPEGYADQFIGVGDFGGITDGDLTAVVDVTQTAPGHYFKLKRYQLLSKLVESTGPETVDGSSYGYCTKEWFER